jgi:hypothetical protein
MLVRQEKTAYSAKIYGGEEILERSYGSLNRGGTTGSPLLSRGPGTAEVRLAADHEHQMSTVISVDAGP